MFLRQKLEKKDHIFNQKIVEINNYPLNNVVDYLQDNEKEEGNNKMEECLTVTPLQAAGERRRSQVCRRVTLISTNANAGKSYFNVS